MSYLDAAQRVGINVDQWRGLNNVCWIGSLNGYARIALPYCQKAVDREPTNPSVRDSRGIARALVGDFAGAILDFQFFVDHASGLPGAIDRQRWIDQLKSGVNPFTPDVLKNLESN